MTTLDKIQKIAKLGKVFSKIVEVVSLVSIIMTLIGCASLQFHDVKLKGISIHSIMDTQGLDSKIVFVNLCVTLIMLVCIRYLATLTYHYFKNELEVGTPFTLEGANELKKLGLRYIVLPIVFYSISQALVNAIHVSAYDFGIEGMVTFGITCIAVSLILQYGYEVQIK